MKDYKGSTEMIVLTNGKVSVCRGLPDDLELICDIQNDGLAYFDVLWGIMMGGWFAKLVKSKGLLVSIFQGEQGV